MILQQEWFMEMMVMAGMSNNKTSDVKKTEVAGSSRYSGGRKQQGIPDKVVAARKFVVCGKYGVRHLDAGCWEDERNADKRPRWHPKYRGDD